MIHITQVTPKVKLELLLNAELLGIALVEAGVAWAHNLLSRAWYILYYHRTSYSCLPLKGRGGLLDGGVRREEADDHNCAIYGVYIYTGEANSHTV